MNLIQSIIHTKRRPSFLIRTGRPGGGATYPWAFLSYFHGQPTESSNGGNIPIPASYLLQEDSGKLLLESGAGALLLET